MRDLGIKKFVLFVVALMVVAVAQAAAIRGVVKDKINKEALIGATVQVDGTTTGTITDFDGQFELAGLRNGTYTLVIQYVSYLTKKVEVTVNGMAEIAVELDPDNQTLGEVVVTATARRNTENALLNQQRTSLVMQTGVSSQHIARTQDKDASEVIRRIPGISIIDEKFVMVRGLAQRYNNVWINNGAVPSSEADSRAFSFDIIPSSQVDNMVVVKSPSPEYPSDFSGGFVLVNTKDVPNNNAIAISLGGSINDQTHFKEFQYNKGSGTDFLGFDNGYRTLKDIHANLNPITGVNRSVDLLNNGLNNDWGVKSFKPIADMSASMNVAQRWVTNNGRTFALLGSANYSSSYKTLLNMKNALFGAYDEANERSTYLHNYSDNQYNQNVRIGAMLNLTYVPASGNSRYEFKNIFNQLARDRYTFRQGIDDQANNTESAEYYYNSRITYNGQFTGKHTLKDESKLNWSSGYAYANQNMPDRRRYLINDALEPGRLGLERANDISREFTKLEEHILSANANYERNFEFGNFTPSLKVGGYSEYRTRTYNARLFNYAYSNNNTLPAGFRYFNIANELLQEPYYGANGLYLLEDVNWINNYEGNNLLAAGYVGANLPFGKLNLYAGVRFEHSNMKLITNTKKSERSPRSHTYTYNDLFPSFNAAYKLNEKHQFRLSYGRTTNRPELREVSPSLFYDFDLASDVQGNVDLQSAYINNFDLSYEFYPSANELVSVSIFYKQFTNPIEWTYTVAGGTGLIYSYTNAKGANNYGIEIDIRKNLDFIGLQNFSWSFNGSLIKSQVTFAEGALEENRPMQGQSPYLINTGFFYQNPNKGWNMALLYNRIGKRIIGVGRSVGSGDQVRIPDSYEMPRNSIDLSLSKKFGDKLEIKASVRDLLAEKVSFKQFAETTKGEVEQVTRQYKPGRNFSLNLNYTF
ncbi:MAG: TonB-dependent receptor domain-containing protein [Phocaeicola sp.]